MNAAIDLATLRLCSVLACFAFVAIFGLLWRGRRDQLHYAHWAMSLILYCIALGGIEWVERTDEVLVQSLLLAVLTASNIPVATGMRLLAGRPPWRWWMVLPPAATLAGFLFPRLLDAMDVSMLAQNRQVLATLGLASGMGVFGCDILRQSERAVPQGIGGRIAGFAMLAYIPCYLYAIVGEILHVGTPTTMAIAALLSDQILLMLLNLGLLAVPAEAALAALRDSAWHDGLTGVHNRAWLATKEAAFLQRGTWLAHIDIDHFKSINDRFGHAAGDAALRGLADALVAEMQRGKPVPAGYVVRMGGDEFLVIMPDASLFAAERLVQDVRAAISRIDPCDWTVSIGMAGVAPSDASLSETLERADKHLYAAKMAGRNRVAA